jgi:hypothetical protein
MDAAQIDRFETNVQLAASAIFAGAASYALYILLRPAFAGLELGALVALGAMVSFLLCMRALQTFGSARPRFEVPIFDVREIEPSSNPDEPILADVDRLWNVEPVLTDRAGGDELVLAEADRFDPDELLLTAADRLNAPAHAEPFVLDDILAELGPDSRVVRLFDRKAMPTPGQLKSRIDDHLEQEERRSGMSDASQALSDALAELRRSLR